MKHYVKTSIDMPPPVSHFTSSGIARQIDRQKDRPNHGQRTSTLVDVTIVYIELGISLCFRDFSQFYNPLHGNCYVFNSGWNESVELKTSTKSGRRHGKKKEPTFCNQTNKRLKLNIYAFYDVIVNEVLRGLTRTQNVRMRASLIRVSCHFDFSYLI